jgi:hypothetical protein
MVSLERVNALLAGQKVDRVPLYHFVLGFCMTLIYNNIQSGGLSWKIK